MIYKTTQNNNDNKIEILIYILSLLLLSRTQTDRQTTVFCNGLKGRKPFLLLNAWGTDRQLRVGFSPLHAHQMRHNFSNTPSDKCVVCHLIENLQHFFLHCTRFAEARRSLVNFALTLNKDDFALTLNKDDFALTLNKDDFALTLNRDDFAPTLNKDNFADSKQGRFCTDTKQGRFCTDTKQGQF